MSLATAHQIFGFSHFVLTRNLDGLTHELSLLRPSGSNSANWVLGHILSTRGVLHSLIGQETPLSEAEATPYRRGSKPSSGSVWLPFGELVERLALSQPRLFEGLEALGLEAWAAIHSADPFQNRPLTEGGGGVGHCTSVTTPARSACCASHWAWAGPWPESRFHAHCHHRTTAASGPHRGPDLLTPTQRAGRRAAGADGLSRAVQPVLRSVPAFPVPHHPG